MFCKYSQRPNISIRYQQHSSNAQSTSKGSPLSYTAFPYFTAALPNMFSPRSPTPSHAVAKAGCSTQSFP